MWYVGPAPKHYRCYRFYVPVTEKTRISRHPTFYPKHCEVPKETQMDEAKRLANDLLHAIQWLQHNNVKHKGRHGKALRALAKIFKMKTDGIDNTHREPM